MTGWAKDVIVTPSATPSALALEADASKFCRPLAACVASEKTTCDVTATKVPSLRRPPPEPTDESIWLTPTPRSAARFEVYDGSSKLSPSPSSMLTMISDVGR